MYKAKSLSGAQRRVRELERQLADRDNTIELLRIGALALAKLAADGPAFFSPLEATQAKIIRDKVLDSVGMRPDGSFKKGPPHARP